MNPPSSLSSLLPPPRAGRTNTPGYRAKHSKLRLSAKVPKNTKVCPDPNFKIRTRRRSEPCNVPRLLSRQVREDSARRGRSREPSSDVTLTPKADSCGPTQFLGSTPVTQPKYLARHGGSEGPSKRGSRTPWPAALRSRARRRAWDTGLATNSRADGDRDCPEYQAPPRWWLLHVGFVLGITKQIFKIHHAQACLRDALQNAVI